MNAAPAMTGIGCAETEKGSRILQVEVRLYAISGVSIPFPDSFRDRHASHD